MNNTRTMLFTANALLFVINLLCHTWMNGFCALLNLWGMWLMRPGAFR